MARVRLGAVPYLNARPLLCFDCGDGAELALGSPRQLGEWLEEGRIEAGIIPTFFHLMHPERPVVAGVGIASRGKVESVRLFLRGEAGELRKVAVDEGSMTSVSLLKIILRRGYDADPQFLACVPELETMMQRAEGALLIGDKGMKAAEEGTYPSLDLGEEWLRLTGLPFVWATWVCRDEEVARRVGPVVHRAKETGMRGLEGLAREAAAQMGLAEAHCLRYLSQTIHYDLGAEETAAIAEFERLWRELG